MEAESMNKRIKKKIDKRNGFKTFAGNRSCMTTLGRMRRANQLASAPFKHADVTIRDPRWHDGVVRPEPSRFIKC